MSRSSLSIRNALRTRGIILSATVSLPLAKALPWGHGSRKLRVNLLLRMQNFNLFLGKILTI